MNFREDYDPYRDPRGFDITRDRNLGPGAPARPITPSIGRPDLAPGYIPHPPPSRVITRPPTGGGNVPIPPSGSFGGYIPSIPPRGALHMDPINKDPYPDPNRDPRGFDITRRRR
jgi:hypothetical protein